MLTESGHVTRVRPGRAVILIRRSSACESCSARGVCLTFGSNERRIEVRDPFGTSVGDEVQIGIPPGRVVWASTVVYIVPVLAMVAGALLGMQVAPDSSRDIVAAACSFAALALCFFGIWVYDRLAGRREDRMPKIVRVIQSGCAPSGS